MYLSSCQQTRDALSTRFLSHLPVFKRKRRLRSFSKGHCVGSGLLRLVEQGGTALSCSEVESGFDSMYHQSFKNPSTLAAYMANIINVPHADETDPALLRIIERLEMYKGLPFQPMKRKGCFLLFKNACTANEPMSLLTEYDRLLEENQMSLTACMPSS